MSVVVTYVCDEVSNVHVIFDAYVSFGRTNAHDAYRPPLLWSVACVYVAGIEFNLIVDFQLNNFLQ